MKEYLDVAVLAFEGAAVLVLILGSVLCLAISTRQLLRGSTGQEAYRAFRRGFARTLLLALDLMLAADVILTASLEFSLESLGALGLLVLIRTFLHFALEVEVTGHFPWQEQRKASGDAQD